MLHATNQEYLLRGDTIAVHSLISPTGLLEFRAPGYDFRDDRQVRSLLVATRIGEARVVFSV
jgi:hypothetical protein